MRPIVLALALLALAPCAEAEPWREDPDPAALRVVEAYATAEQPTAVMVVRDGRVVARFGDVARKVNVASVRKSLLGALVGIAAADGRIALDATLAELDIDDVPPLTEAERHATVRDLLAARSGVYHPAAHETGEMRRNRPKRGSHAPGTHWFYNNWDFNALGTIFRERTGEDIFAAFAERVAAPIGMEDFSARDGSYATEKQSRHSAYPFRLSARDAARFGQLYRDGGRWGGRQIVPAEWVTDSTTARSRTDRGSMGYGYLWWTLNPKVFGPGAALASGYGGQAIAIVPGKRLVVVQTVDPAQNRGGVRTSAFVRLLQRLAAAR